EILMHLRKTSRMKTEVSFDEPLNADADGNELLLSDILGTEATIIIDNVERKIERQHMLDAVVTLNDREKYIMACRFGLTGNEEERSSRNVRHFSKLYFPFRKENYCGITGKIKHPCPIDWFKLVRLVTNIPPLKGQTTAIVIYRMWRNQRWCETELKFVESIRRHCHYCPMMSWLKRLNAIKVVIITRVKNS